MTLEDTFRIMRETLGYVFLLLCQILEKQINHFVEKCIFDHLSHGSFTNISVGLKMHKNCVPPTNLQFFKVDLHFTNFNNMYDLINLFLQRLQKFSRFLKKYLEIYKNTYICCYNDNKISVNRCIDMQRIRYPQLLQSMVSIHMLFLNHQNKLFFYAFQHVPLKR